MDTSPTVPRRLQAFSRVRDISRANIHRARAVAKASAPKPQPAVFKPFRFLDLPAEMRNRVYDDVAARIYERPILVANRQGAQEETIKLELGKFVSDAKHARVVLDIWKEPHQGHRRFALLVTCRQVRHEAHTILVSAVGLDLRFIMLQSSVRPMRLLQTYWMDKLQFIRHLKIDRSSMQAFLMGGITTPDAEKWDGKWGRFYGSEESAKDARILRIGLVNIESVTVQQMQNQGQSAMGGVWMACLLAQDEYREAAGTLFPNLKDIKCYNQLGAERFKKTSDGHWRMWYTGQRLPLELHEDFERGDMDQFGMSDEEGFMTGYTLGLLGEIPSDDEEGGE